MVVGARFVLTNAALLVATGACSSFGSSDSPDGGSDAGAAADAADTGAPPLFSERFEADDGNCGGLWAGRTTTSINRVPAVGTDGSFACRICSGAKAGEFFGLQTLVAMSATGTSGTYMLEANVRDESTGPSARVSAAFVIGGRFEQGSEASASGWNHVSYRLPVTEAKEILATVSGRAVTSPTCLLVDDIVLRRVD